MSQLFPVALSAAAVFFVGTLLLVCHELGHYLAARYHGVTAQRFVIGFGPTIAKMTDRHGTDWKLGLAPIGGYVSFPSEHDAAVRGGYASTSAMTRMAIIAAGPLANLLLAFILYIGMLALNGEPAFLPIASSIVPGSAAAHAGFELGDRIAAMDGAKVEVFEDMRPGLRDGAGKTVHFQVERHGEMLDLFAGLGAIQEGERTIGVLGIRSTMLTHLSLGPGAMVARAASKTWTAVADTAQGVWRAVAHGQGHEDFAGAVGVVQMTAQAANESLATLLSLAALLSTNLALMNLLPIPVLDGGALLFCLAEWIMGRPVPYRFRSLTTGMSVAALVTMFAMATMHDLDGFGMLNWLTHP